MFQSTVSGIPSSLNVFPGWARLSARILCSQYSTQFSRKFHSRRGTDISQISGIPCHVSFFRNYVRVHIPRAFRDPSLCLSSHQLSSSFHKLHGHFLPIISQNLPVDGHLWCEMRCGERCKIHFSMGTVMELCNLIAKRRTLQSLSKQHKV